MSPEYILLLERWIVVPIIAYAIAHGFIGAEQQEMAVKAVDNILASTFLILYFLLKHRTKSQGDSTETPPQTQSKLRQIIDKMKALLIDKPQQQ